MASATFESLSGPERAAAVLLTLEEGQAASVIRHMDEKALGAVTDAMASMHSVDTETSYNIFLTLINDLEQAGAIAGGGFSYFRKLLTSAFGDKRAAEILERIMRSGTGAIDVLTNIDPRILADQVKDERPQLIAVLLGHMSRTAGTVFINTLTPPFAMEIMTRFARMDTVQPFALIELRAMLSEMLGGHVESRASTIGGIRPTADLLNSIGSAMAEQILERIREDDPALADEIRESMFTFDDLDRLTDSGLQILLASVDTSRLVPALRGASAVIRNRIYNNMATKEGVILREDVETGPMVSRAESQNAKREIIEIAMKLSQEGKLSLGGADEMV